MNKESNELQYLQALKRQVLLSLKHAPQGKLRCELAKGKYPQYYITETVGSGGTTIERYLRKSEWEIAKSLAQRDYDLQLLKQIEAKEKALIHAVSAENRDLRTVYSNLSKPRKSLVTPRIQTDEQFKQEWLCDTTVSTNPFPILNAFPTENGETVRSKTEKIIADKLYYKGIPYKYEKPLQLKNHAIIYPDFTIANVRTRKIYYLEHFGLMDNPEYCKKALEKIDSYEENQIFLGDSLLVTFESSMKSLNVKSIDAIINRYFI